MATVHVYEGMVWRCQSFILQLSLLPLTLEHPVLLRVVVLRVMVVAVSTIAIRGAADDLAPPWVVATSCWHSLHHGTSGITSVRTMANTNSVTGTLQGFNSCISVHASLLTILDYHLLDRCR